MGQQSTIQTLKEKIKKLEYEYYVADTLLENATDAIQISDRNLVTLRINKAYEVLTGLNREEVVGIPVADLVKAELISESCGAIVAKTKKPHTIIQKFPRTGRAAHVSCNPVFDDNGEIEFYICNDRDLNEISNLLTKLNEAENLNAKYRTELEFIKSKLPGKGKIIAEDISMLRVLALASRIAKVDSTVLISGETGVGKDEIAHFIHQHSNRAQNRFASINCGAITESLFESELFGHEARAFTGAGNKLRRGLLETADGGTLLLDEIGELSLKMQTKLLHVLQNQSFLRIGGTQPIQISVRIIAATNRDLLTRIHERQFREDLYYRLNVLPIIIPPLRERKNDIIPLAQHFLEYYNKKYNFRKVLSHDAGFTLLENPWAGNVRQLKNVIEQAVILSDEDTVTRKDLPLDSMWQQKGVEMPEDASIAELLERMEYAFLSQYYEKYGSVRAAAQQLKMSPSTFQRHRVRLMKKYHTLKISD
ncbi:MAG: sigma 54-interacting transcriptional regulator [Synergistaceae bacterium]|nr:sigma 54-interacting transcriptional regulator [Synergistaceae bacterium]